MRLKNDIDYRNLLKKAKACDGDVVLKTEQGDMLNLCSELSQYIVLFLVEKKELLRNAWIECADKADEEKLAEFCE